MVDQVVTGPQEGQQRSRPLLRTMLGDVLRRTRLEQGRTLADVARSARVSMPYLSEVERGRKEASSEVLAAICDALRIELADVLAATGRDLVDDSNRRARVVRLEAIRAGRALMDRADPAGRALLDRADPAGLAPASRSGDAVCLLAA
jgi:transcriptional regulator with XRE-family HTH domain